MKLELAYALVIVLLLVLVVVTVNENGSLRAENEQLAAECALKFEALKELQP